MSDDTQPPQKNETYNGRYAEASSEWCPVTRSTTCPSDPEAQATCTLC